MLALVFGEGYIPQPLEWIAAPGEPPRRLCELSVVFCSVPISGHRKTLEGNSRAFFFRSFISARTLSIEAKLRKNDAALGVMQKYWSRVSKFPLQPHQQLYVTQYEDLGFSLLLR